jgi:hypothetical protein
MELVVAGVAVAAVGFSIWWLARDGGDAQTLAATSANSAAESVAPPQTSAAPGGSDVPPTASGGETGETPDTQPSPAESDATSTAADQIPPLSAGVRDQFLGEDCSRLDQGYCTCFLDAIDTLATDQQVRDHIDGAAELPAEIAGPAAAACAPLRFVLKPDGVGNVPFGRGVTDTVNELSAVFGEPTGRDQFDCAGVTPFKTAEWGPLKLFFQVGEGLVGYDYGTVYPDAAFGPDDDPWLMPASPDGETLLYLGMTRLEVEVLVPEAELFAGHPMWPNVEDAIYGEPLIEIVPLRDIDDLLVASLWATPEGNEPSARVLRFSAGFGCRD